MPYHVGEKGSYGCSGYPAVKDDGTVMGCHNTKEEAANQIFAINQSEGNVESKDVVTSGGGVGIKNPQAWPGTEIKDPKLKKNSITEGSFVMGKTSEGVIHGVVEHIMWEGGTLGTPGSAYSLESMPPENPAMSVRIFTNSGSGWEPTAYSIGMMYLDAKEFDMEEHTMSEKNESIDKQAPCWDGYVQRGMKPGDGGRMVPNCVPAEKFDDLWEDDDDVIYDIENVEKAEGYSPPAGARAAARRAIKFKEDGKATGAGTAVGWTRARQLANGETLSLSTVKRMYSYFSRHEVDKKGKDWGNTANPSNGYIMWLAWGGDAGFSWARRIVERETDKALFAEFGKTISKISRNNF
jgi:hypothetical protein